MSPPSTQGIREHMAVMRQMHNNVGPRVECRHCGHELVPGQEPATHATCEECAIWLRHPISMGDVVYLWTLSEVEWGRYMRVDTRGEHESGEAAATHSGWKRTNNRARAALTLMVEDLERAARDARDARDHLIREWRAER